ncbi:hypothetical protein ACFXPX_04665 [Kitasatospora sp. NPDC059146]|uniref:hypothetical protein n=1 Tax=unclassified Kitasatospora TaxID=2633591 RepID=UPI0036A6F7D4
MTAISTPTEPAQDRYPPPPDEPHQPDCPGGCDGTGVHLVTMTWDDQGDGIFVPVHQEHVDCSAGQDQEPHPEDCAECDGTGFSYEHGYRHLCQRNQAPGRPPFWDDIADDEGPSYPAADDHPF